MNVNGSIHAKTNLLYIYIIFIVCSCIIYNYIQNYIYINLYTNSQSDPPEPEQDVELLVEDVEGQHAQAVGLLDRSRRAIPLETALSDLRIDR